LFFRTFLMIACNTVVHEDAWQHGFSATYL
jgi:hypothetical protein